MLFRWVATFLIIWFIYHVRSVFPPFIVGGILAYLLLPLVQNLSTSLKIRPTQAVAIVYLLGAVVLIISGWFFLPLLSEQCVALAMHRQEIITNIVRQAAETFNLQLDVDITANQIIANIEESFGKPEEIVHIGGLLSHGLLGILVCVVSSIYFIIDKERVGNFAIRFLPADKREQVVNLSGQINQMMSNYVKGQLMLIIIMSTIAWVFLHFVIHLKYALVIALISGFLEIIPVLGPIIATTIAALVGLAQFGVMAALGIIGYYTLARWFEDYVIVPKIIGHAVELHPLIVIFAVLCGEVMAGALGMLIAIPVAACFKLILESITHPAKLAQDARESS